MADNICSVSVTQREDRREAAALNQAGLPPEIVARFWAKVNRTDGCWEWQASRNNYGYGLFHVGVGAAGRIRSSAHRFAYELAHGPIPKGLNVCHSCDNPPCCNPAHLFLGTQRDNVLDAARKGRTPAEQPSRWILAADVRRDVIARGLDGENLSKLAREHNVSPASLHMAVRRARVRRLKPYSPSEAA